MLAGGQCGAQVVVQQSVSRGIRVCRVVGGGKGAGVLAEQVVQAIAAGRGLGEQVLVIQLIEAASCLIQPGVVEGSGGANVEVGTRVEPEPAEQPLLGRGEVVVGQAEHGRDLQILRAHHGQPVPGRRQIGSELRGGPCRVVPQLAGEHPDRQRQVAAQPGDLTHRGIAGAHCRPAREPG